MDTEELVSDVRRAMSYYGSEYGHMQQVQQVQQLGQPGAQYSSYSSSMRTPLKPQQHQIEPSMNQASGGTSRLQGPLSSPHHLFGKAVRVPVQQTTPNSVTYLELSAKKAAVASPAGAAPSAKGYLQPTAASM
jgi:hypothetical protein